MSSPQSAPLPVYYSLNGGPLKAVPSTGVFGSFGKATKATSKGDALYKLKLSTVKMPYGFRTRGVDSQADKYIVDMQNGGKSRKGRKTKRRRTKKTRRVRRM